MQQVCWLFFKWQKGCSNTYILDTFSKHAAGAAAAERNMTSFGYITACFNRPLECISFTYFFFHLLVTTKLTYMFHKSIWLSGNTSALIHNQGLYCAQITVKLVHTFAETQQQGCKPCLLDLEVIRFSWFVYIMMQFKWQCWHNPTWTCGWSDWICVGDRCPIGHFSGRRECCKHFENLLKYFSY